MATQTQPRIHAKADDLVPRILVRIMFGLVACVLVIVSFATLTGRPPEATPPDAPVTSTTDSRMGASVADSRGRRTRFARVDRA